MPKFGFFLLLVALATCSTVGAFRAKEIFKGAPTTIFIKKTTSAGDYMFLRGADNNGQPIPIEHVTTNYWEFSEYDNFKVNDVFLSWGAQTSEETALGQGTHNGLAALGTPLMWSTNAFDLSTRQATTGYQPLNKYGDHYWMVQLNIDCRALGIANGVDAYTNNWEGSPSAGADGHFEDTTFQVKVRCGAVNVFTFGESGCRREPPLTTIFVKRANPNCNTPIKEDVFLRGGGYWDWLCDCSQERDASPMPIKHATLDNPQAGSCYSSWKVNDNYLSLAENIRPLTDANQGKCNGVDAKGTPMIWSTNDQSDTNYYQFLNQHVGGGCDGLGPDYHMVTLEIDCENDAWGGHVWNTNTDAGQWSEGWFSAQAYLSHNDSPSYLEETKIRSWPTTCGGNAGGTAGYKTNHCYSNGHHQVRCGYVNVRVYGSVDPSKCEVYYH